MVKIIIAGSRNFDKYQALKAKCDYFLSGMNEEIMIVSGGANGTDKLGERYARERGYMCTIFKPDWEKDGKAAGVIRNEKMAKYSDYLIAFWDGYSKGTKNMIDNAQKYKLKTRVIKIS